MSILENAIVAYNDKFIEAIDKKIQFVIENEMIIDQRDLELIKEIRQL